MIPILITSLLLAATPNVQVQTLGGRTLSGPLVAMNTDRIAVEQAGKQIEFPVDELVSLGIKEPATASGPTPSVWIDLVDGSSLVGQGYTVRGDRAQIRLGGQPLDISRNDVASVRFQRPIEASAAEWARVFGAKIAGDLLVIRKEEAIDYHKGLIGDVSESEVQFELDGERLPVKRSKLAGLVYYHPPGRALPDSICRIAEVGGSRWAARTIAWSDRLEWTTPTGLKMSRALSQIRRIDFSSDKVVYLSDLEPESRDWTPFFRPDKEVPALSQFYAPRSDRNLRGGKLQLGGRPYAKGLALYSRTTIVYRLPDRFRRLKATAGIDDDFRPNGSVRLVIRGDERVLLETTVTGEALPTPIDVDLTGVRRLTIVADFGAGFGVGNHLLLCEARVIK